MAGVTVRNEEGLESAQNLRDLVHVMEESISERESYEKPSVSVEKESDCQKKARKF